LRPGGRENNSDGGAPLAWVQIPVAGNLHADGVIAGRESLNPKDAIAAGLGVPGKRRGGGAAGDDQGGGNRLLRLAIYDRAGDAGGSGLADGYRANQQ
jgi:hypothetical protein